jgi:hypothetical protein
MSRHRQNQPEPTSWWPLVAIILGAFASYAVLLVHLVLEATHAPTWMWTSMMAVPTGLFFASALTIVIGSGIPLRERLATIPAGVLGYSPRTPMLRERAGQVGRHSVDHGPQ